MSSETMSSICFWYLVAEKCPVSKENSSLPAPFAMAISTIFIM